MAPQWGDPPSEHTLLVVLQSLEQRLDSRLPAEQLLLVLEASQKAVLALAAPQPAAQAAPAAAGRDAGAALGVASQTAGPWPPLRAPLAEAAVELLLACFEESGRLPGDGGGAAAQRRAAAALQQGVEAVLEALCAAQLPLSFWLCSLLLDAFRHVPEAEAWAVARFRPRLPRALEDHVNGVHDRTVLRTRRGWPRTLHARQAGHGAGKAPLRERVHVEGACNLKALRNCRGGRQSGARHGSCKTSLGSPCPACPAATPPCPAITPPPPVFC